MKRLLVALLLFATPASAKTLIVANTADGNDATYGMAERADSHARVQILTSILDAFGASYVVIAPAAMKTEWARTGVVTHDFGTSAARTESFDAVIHATFTRKHQGTPQFAGYRPDSLGLAGTSAATNRIPLVPQLLLGHPDGANGLLAQGGQMYTTATTCSLGGIGGAGSAWESAGFGSGTHDQEGVYYQTAQSDGFTGTQNIGHGVLSTAAGNAARGLSVLLAQGSGPIGGYYDESLVWSANWDSTGRKASPDTAMVWMIRNLHYSGGKPIIVAHLSDGNSDGGGGLLSVTEPMDVPVLMVALAALDSASGGRVFDNKARLPLKVGITVDGLCARSGALNSGGIVPTDTANFYATLDSLDALDVPVVFGVNLDSVATYERDLIYAMRNPHARFSPQSRAGLDTAVAFAPTGGITHRYRAVDTFGRYRNQARAYGLAGGAAADTSLYAKLIYAKAIGDSMWGRTRTSMFALPPDDDWSPYNWRAWQADPSRGVTQDSILFAYAKAGFRGIRINGAWDVARPDLNPTNPRGYVPDQGRYETADRGLSINLLAHNGGSTGGNLAHYSVTDSTVPGTVGSTPPTLSFYVAQRFWYGLLGYTPLALTSGYDGATDDNATATIGRGRILKVSAQELAGAGLNTSYKETLRPSWWAIRQVVLPIRIMNRIAGRTIMQVDYPENISLQ